MAPPAKSGKPAGGGGAPAPKTVRNRAIAGKKEIKGFGMVQIAALLTGIGYGFFFIRPGFVPASMALATLLALGFIGACVAALFAIAGSLVAYVREAEDEAHVLWTAMGSPFGGVLQWWLREARPWNFGFTFALNLAGWAVGIAAKFALTAMIAAAPVTPPTPP